jgi:hypothetical protein
MLKKFDDGTNIFHELEDYLQETKAPPNFTFLPPSESEKKESLSIIKTEVDFPVLTMGSSKEATGTTIAHASKKGITSSILLSSRRSSAVASFPLPPLSFDSGVFSSSQGISFFGAYEAAGALLELGAGTNLESAF